MQKPMLQAKRLSMKILRLAIGSVNSVTKFLLLNLVVLNMKSYMKSNLGGKVFQLIRFKR